MSAGSGGVVRAGGGAEGAEGQACLTWLARVHAEEKMAFLQCLHRWRCGVQAVLGRAEMGWWHLRMCLARSAGLAKEKGPGQGRIRQGIGASGGRWVWSRGSM